MISIRPKWCELIAGGKKTIEVRKTRPKLEPPFKCYIYCTKPSFPHEDFFFTDDGGREIRGFYGGGKVIGEFICDSVKPFDVPFPAYRSETDFDTLRAACLSYTEAHAYLGHRTGYGWHISDLVIYNNPKELSEFMKPCTPDPDGVPLCLQCKRLVENYGCGGTILRPPQSWCYVEELT